MKLGGKMSRLKEPYRQWVAGGGQVEITAGSHLRWMYDGKTEFHSGSTISRRNAIRVRLMVRKHLAAKAKPA